MPMNDDDRTLLIATHRGHEPSARLLWERHGPALLAYASSLVGAADADDVVQTVMCSILTTPRSTLRKIDNTRAWLLRATRSAALNNIRSRRRRRTREQADHTPLGMRKTQPPAGALQRLEPALASAIDALPRRLREPIVLRHLAGLSFTHLAAALGLNRSTAATRYEAAINELRKQLATEASAFGAGGNGVCASGTVEDLKLTMSKP